jgi:cell division protein FtsQ
MLKIFCQTDKNMWKQHIISSLWWLLGLCICSLLTAGVQYKKHLPCSDIKVNINSVKGHVFIDEKDITQILNSKGAVIGKIISNIYLQQLESLLKQQPWIYNAELFFDNNQVLNVSILEREPIARIFTLQGISFYIDSSTMQLPLSTDYSARVPMFTAFISNRKRFSKQDSLMMNDIKKIAMIIQQDSFWNAQVSQVNITPVKTFQIVPVLGNQLIKLGNADSLQSKFERLTAFYKQVWAKEGFEKYESISVEFSGQIVAVKRGVIKPIIDTVEAQRLISAMRSGEDIIKDTLTVTHTEASPSLLHINDTDSLAKPITKTVALNKSIKPNNTVKKSKSPLAANRTVKGTKKGVTKSRKRASG